MFWMRLLLYLDAFRFLGTMIVVLKVMMQESAIFFLLLILISVGFLQAFVGLNQIDNNRTITTFIVQSMANSVMQSPDFGGFGRFAPPFGIVLYYLYTFVVMVVLLNILIALYNSCMRFPCLQMRWRLTNPKPTRALRTILMMSIWHFLLRRPCKHLYPNQFEAKIRSGNSSALQMRMSSLPVGPSEPFAIEAH